MANTAYRSQAGCVKYEKQMHLKADFFFDLKLSYCYKSPTFAAQILQTFCLDTFEGGFEA